MHHDLIEAVECLVARPPRVASAENREALERDLYDWYLNPSPLPAPSGPLLPYELDLPAALRGAHWETTRFEGGWKAETVSSWGRAVAVKGELSRVLDRSEYTIPGRRGLRAQPADLLVVSRFWDWIDEDTGFWHQRRGTWPPPGAERLVRTYWNCVPSEVPRVIGELSVLLGAAQEVPFMMKTPARSEHNGRADAVVFYLGPEGFARLESGLRATAERLRPFLRPAVPRMTHPLVPGVGLAEGTLAGDSFGESRSRLLAATFSSADPEARRSVQRLRDLVRAAFQAAGLDPERPYLEPGALRDYAG